MEIRSNWLLLVICGLVMFVTCFFFEHLVFADCVTTQCHVGISEFTHPHEPVAEGDCLACHRQISDQHPLTKGKSFTLVATGAALCRQCHDPISGERIHEPVAEGDCLACHQPHGSNAENLLVADGDQLVICLDCHDRDAFEQKRCLSAGGRHRYTPPAHGQTTHFPAKFQEWRHNSHQ